MSAGRVEGRRVERGAVLTEADLWAPEGGWPDTLQRARVVMYQREVYGPFAVGLAVKAVLAGGGPERFALCFTPGGKQGRAGGPIVDAVRGFGWAELAGVRCVRWLGEDSNPNGPGSSATVASWYGPEASDPAIVSAWIAVALWSELPRLPGHSAELFRLKRD